MPHLTFRRQKLHAQSPEIAMSGFFSIMQLINQSFASLLNYLDFKQINTKSMHTYRFYVFLQ